MSAETLLPWGSCKTCNSERPSSPCWKCGGAVDPVAAGWEWPGLNDICRIRELAREVGYAVGVHGSMQRDQDLIAVPWMADAVGPLALAQHIAAGLGGRVVDYQTQDKPCGRWSCNIHTPDWTKLIDLSVMPPAHPPQPDAPCWRDIATAPRDGKSVLVSDGLYVGSAWAFDDEDGWYFDADGDRADPAHPQPTHWQPLPPPPSADTKQAEALPGDLRERVARRAAAAILEQDGYSAVGPYLNADLTLDYLDQGEVDFGKVADAILSLIQSERGGA